MSGTETAYPANPLAAQRRRNDIQLFACTKLLIKMNMVITTAKQNHPLKIDLYYVVSFIFKICAAYNGTNTIALRPIKTELTPAIA